VEHADNGTDDLAGTNPALRIELVLPRVAWAETVFGTVARRRFRHKYGARRAARCFSMVTA